MRLLRNLGACSRLGNRRAAKNTRHGGGSTAPQKCCGSVLRCFGMMGLQFVHRAAAFFFRVAGAVRAVAPPSNLFVRRRAGLRLARALALVLDGRPSAFPVFFL